MQSRTKIHAIGHLVPASGYANRVAQANWIAGGAEKRAVILLKLDTAWS